MLDNRHTRALTFEVVDLICDPAGAVNDDCAGVAADSCWVLDGATDVSPDKLLPGASDAAWIAESFSAAFRDLAPGFQGSLLDLAGLATERVAAAFAAARLREAPSRGRRPSAAGLLFRLRDGWAEVLGMGDCQLLLSVPGAPVCLCGVERDRLGDRRSIARIEAHAGATGLTWQEARLSLQPQLATGRERMNLSGGYAVFSLDMPPAGLVVQDRFAMPSGTRALLMTDGFARLSEVFGLYNDEALLEAAFQHGLAPLLAELRAAENADPACAAVRRMKPRDDATAIAIRVL